MNTQELTQTLLKGSFDRGTLLRRIGVARQYLEQVHFTPNKQPFADWAKKEDIRAEDVSVFAGLDGPFWDSFTQENMYKSLEEIRLAIGALPAVGLYFPLTLEPTEMFKVGSWLREHVNSHVVMDVHVDESVIGGCAITASGMWRDYSVRYYMRKKRDEIVGIMDKYVKEGK
jgi:hypothetical protein